MMEFCVQSIPCGQEPQMHVVILNTTKCTYYHHTLKKLFKKVA